MKTKIIILLVTLYGEGSDENKTARPGVVLVHGETPEGRKLPVYRRNESNEVIQAVSYLYNLRNIDRSKIYAIGHSGGAYPVMQAGLENPCF